jgi:hypothetical protein
MQLPELTLAQVARLLEAALTIIQVEVAALDEARLRWRPAEGEWCVKEVVGHLIEAERRGFGGRVRTFLNQDGPTCQTWEPAEVARARHDDERDMGELLREFAAVRREYIAMVEGITSAQLSRWGNHPHVGRLTVRDLLHEWVHHDRNHIKQIMSNVQATIWPHMGNSQRFAEID